MALIDIDTTYLSDLVVHEVSPSVGYARRVIALSDTATAFPMGTVVKRTIASGSLDQGAQYAKAAVGDLVATNEFAVVFGDAYGVKETFTTSGVAGDKAVAFVRGEVILKDELLMKSLSITDRTSADYKALKALLEKQGIIIETTLGA